MKNAITVIPKNTKAEPAILDLLYPPGIHHQGRRLSVLRLLAQGYSTKEIAADLGISNKTAQHHLAHLRRVTGLSSTAQLTQLALKYHLIEFTI